MVYLFLKFIHLIAAIIYLSGFTFSLYSKSKADKSASKEIISDIFTSILNFEKKFIMPSFIILFVFGIGAALHGKHNLFETTWIFWSLIIFVVLGYLIMTKIVPLEKKIIAIDSAAEFDLKLYESLSKTWKFWTIVSLILSYGTVALMVFKPQL